MTRAFVVGGFTEYSSERAASGDRLIELVDAELTDRGLERFLHSPWNRVVG